MIEFFSGCTGLFTMICEAVIMQDYFKLLIIFLVFQIYFGLFLLLSRGTRK